MKIKMNCENCGHLSSDDSGDDWGSNPFPVCDKDLSKTYLKSFPFKKEQECCVLDFWAVLEKDKKMKALFDKDNHDLQITDLESYKMFKKKYIRPL